MGWGGFGGVGAPPLNGCGVELAGCPPNGGVLPNPPLGPFVTLGWLGRPNPGAGEPKPEEPELRGGVPEGPVGNDMAGKQQPFRAQEDRASRYL